MSNTVVIDLDGVIIDFENCEYRGTCNYTNYPHGSTLHRDKCKYNTDSRSIINLLDTMGINIIIYTSRDECERGVTEKWLSDNGIHYDELVMNKPRGFIYIDDLAHRFTSWHETYHEIVTRLKMLQ